LFLTFFVRRGRSFRVSSGNYHLDVVAPIRRELFSIVKRGIIGEYHHVSEAHLHRYMLEFDFRYNTRAMRDFDRMAASMGGIVGKRLTYRRPVEEGRA
jgi:hypothetical protein